MRLCVVLIGDRRHAPRWILVFQKNLPYSFKETIGPSCDGHYKRPQGTPYTYHQRPQHPLAEPELQKRGGQILARIFERPFLGVPEKITAFPPKIVIYLPKFLMTFFLVIDLFNVLTFRLPGYLL